MQSTHTPLSVWFWGAYLVTTQTPGQSALQFQRQLGLSRYETAFQILHKLRAGMVRPDRDLIGGEYPVEVDETFIGGVHNKTIVVGAVEVRDRKDAEQRAAKHRQQHASGVPLKKLVYAGRLRLRTISADCLPRALLIHSDMKTNWLDALVGVVGIWVVFPSVGVILIMIGSPFHRRVFTLKTLLLINKIKITGQLTLLRLEFAPQFGVLAIKRAYLIN